MQPYTGFAEVYDKFMNNVPYDHWADFVDELLMRYGAKKGLLLELGCGTGSMTERMAARGYDLIGVDFSEDMLAQAQEKKIASGHEILYLNQDMRSFELYGTVAGVYCVCDSLNYILDYDELVQVFRLVNNYLDPGGIFVLDFTTEKNFSDGLREIPIVESDGDDIMIWENIYDEEEAVNEHRLTFFLCAEDGRYDRVDEVHLQRAYSLAEIHGALADSGMIFLDAFDSETHGEPCADSVRIHCVARENGKQVTAEKREESKEDV